MAFITSMHIKRNAHTQSLYPLIIDAIIIVFLTTLSISLRVIAALHTGTEVDEPIYRFAAVYFLHHGFPAVRPELSEPVIPFLYHPPFALMLLGAWFRLWGCETLLIGRMLSILCSSLFSVILYLFLARSTRRTIAISACLLMAIDPWLIFTNQAIYLENSQMLFCALFAWSYWYAIASKDGSAREYIGRYALTGIFLGIAIIWKHIGGFLVISVLAHFLLQRKHLRGHLVLLGIATFIIAAYVIAMHYWFGELYDYATMVQIKRTLWNRYSPGLNYSPWEALQVIYLRYYIFPITILVLIGGALLTIVRYCQHLFKRRPLTAGNTTVLTWALGGIIFAAISSLKSPHYMILWLVPLYMLIAIEGVPLFERLVQQTKANGGFLPLAARAGLVVCLCLVVGANLWSFRMRFLNHFGDTLTLADTYINQHIPDNAVIITQDYFGVDIQPRYINIAGITRSDQALNSSASYMALYWSTTEPLSTTLQAVHARCTTMAAFTGFKDHVEICRLMIYKGHNAALSIFHNKR
jgi:4-amino-4-deoxy-L-arabinose transferase and related glycosyltransferases of PMT family